MSKSIGDRINEAVLRLESLGLDDYSEMLNDAYRYSSSSSEIYFKCSGILKAILNNNEIKDEIFLKNLDKLKSDIDKNIR